MWRNRRTDKQTAVGETEGHIWGICYALFATIRLLFKKWKKGKKEKTLVHILRKGYGINNSNVVESLGTQQFPKGANSPHFLNRDIPYCIHQNSQLTPVLKDTNPIRAFKSAPQVFKTIFLLEVFSSKYCTLGGLFARLPARSHYLRPTISAQIFLVFSVF